MPGTGLILQSKIDKSKLFYIADVKISAILRDEDFLQIFDPVTGHRRKFLQNSAQIFMY